MKLELTHRNGTICSVHRDNDAVGDSIEVVRISVDGVVIWEAPKPKVRVHTERLGMSYPRYRFIREEGDFDVFAMQYCGDKHEYLVLRPAEYA